MAVVAITRIEPVRTISGNEPQTLTFPEDITQTYLQGAILIFNPLNGMLKEGAANPTSIVGIAAAPGQNTATAGLLNNAVWVANSDTIFRGNLVSVSAGAAVAASSAPGALVVAPGNYAIAGGMYGITKISTGVGLNNWVVDLAKNARTNARVVVTNFDPRGTGYPTVTDTYPIVEFVFFGFFTYFGMTS